MIAVLPGRLAALLPSALTEALRLARGTAQAFALRWTSRRLGVVLVYHRVGAAGGDPSVEVDPAFPARLLEAQLSHLRRWYRVVPAADILRATAQRRRGRPFPVAITFDDDLSSHLEHVAPLVARLGIPATVFLTGASLGGPSSHWWHDLQRAVDERLLQERDLPEIEASLARSALERRPRAIRRLARAVESLPPEPHDAVARRLRELAGDSGAERGLRAADVSGLVAAGLAVGFHTLRHYDLRSLADEALARALEEGRAELERAAGARLTLLAYPHGKCDGRIADAARHAGFRLGFTGAAEPVRPGDDPLSLGRLQPTRASLGRFAQELAATLWSSEAR